MNNYEENEDGVPVEAAKVFTQDFKACSFYGIAY
jgi:hypothetical protein